MYKPFTEPDSVFAAMLRGDVAPTSLFKPGDQVGRRGVLFEDQSKLHNAGVVIAVPDDDDIWDRNRCLVRWDDSTDAKPNQAWIHEGLIKHLPINHPRRFQEGQAVQLLAGWGRTWAVIENLFNDGSVVIEWADARGNLTGSTAVRRGRINPPKH